MGCIERWYGTATGGGQTGSVSVTQRFGSSLRLNPHFHVLFVDGGYVRGKEGGVRFRPARAHPSDVEALIVEIATACEAWLARQGHGPEDAAEEADDEGMRLFQAAAVAGYSVVRGAPTRVARRVQRIGGRERELPPLCASCDGWNLHAGVVVEAEDREGLLRLGRYLLRPPLAVDRLEVEPDGRVRFSMKRTFEDGTAALSFTAEELVSRLVALIPPPRANTIVYRGVFAGNASLRAAVVAEAPGKARPTTPFQRLRRQKEPLKSKRLRPSWGEILYRVFAEDGWRCPGCGCRMTLRAVFEGGPTTSQVLASLRRSAAASRGPPAAVA